MKGIALVTGAGSGIGRQSALALAHAGWTVVLAGRRLDALEAVAAEIAQQGGTCFPWVTDVADAASVRALYAEIERRYGRLDVLFNNAGIFPAQASIEAIEDDEWLRVVNTNLNGAFYCARAAYRLMKSQSPRGGRIINNGSISAQVPRPLSVAYSTTKHAITGLTRSLALDGRVHDIACGQIDIGNAASDMTQLMTAGILQANGQRQAEATMDVQHVAEAVVYMAGLPLSANVLFMTVMATAMPFVGRG